MGRHTLFIGLISGYPWVVIEIVRYRNVYGTLLEHLWTLVKRSCNVPVTMVRDVNLRISLGKQWDKGMSSLLVVEIGNKFGIRLSVSTKMRGFY